MRGQLSLNEPVGTIAALAPAEMLCCGARDRHNYRGWKPCDRISIGQSSHCGRADPSDWTSDIPAGVVNILFADHNDVAKHTAMHMDIDAVWCEETAAFHQ